MNESEINLKEEHDFDNPFCSEMDSVLVTCFKVCHNNYFLKFKHECIYKIKNKTITNNETIDFTVSGKKMNLYDLNNKFKIARERGFIFNHINRVTIKCYSHQRHINISFCLKSPIPMCHSHFFRVISRYRDYVDLFCND